MPAREEYITVKVGKLPGAIQEIALNGDRTVAAALTAASLEVGECEVRVNASAASPETTVSNGDTILLVKKIRGN
jgi:sulfur carrier protein ThiS